MVPLAALLSCTLYADDALVAAIADNVEQNPLSIVIPDEHSDSEAAPAAPSTIDQARAKLGEIMAHGGSPLLGLMQVPPAWARTFGREPEEPFDACVNVSIGTAMLSEFEYACSRRVRAASPRKTLFDVAESRRRCVLDRYARAIGMPEVSTVVMLNLHYSRTRPGVVSEAPIYAPPSAAHTWGAHCLFVDTASEWPRSSPLTNVMGPGALGSDRARVAGWSVGTPPPVALGQATGQANAAGPK
jgi:hypothetical protein